MRVIAAAAARHEYFRSDAVDDQRQAEGDDRGTESPMRAVTRLPARPATAAPKAQLSIALRGAAQRRRSSTVLAHAVVWGPKCVKRYPRRLRRLGETPQPR
ncbi:MAG TPA: hypothetical protein VNT55_05255 [Baekduia sp.]|nr:hypothetical protein [Baekduia sp.]